MTTVSINELSHSETNAIIKFELLTKSAVDPNATEHSVTAANRLFIAIQDNISINALSHSGTNVIPKVHC